MTIGVAGLFSGIGGLEEPFAERGAQLELVCDTWEPSRRVLRARRPQVKIWQDVATLERLPSSAGIVTAGFPCTDLSQAGLMRGIGGSASGLVAHVFRLVADRSVEWVIIENVKNMLALDKGRAMEFIVNQFECLGFSWAYRTVDSRFTGVPQRRQRVIFVASRKHDPRDVLFHHNADDTIPKAPNGATGFYWTEGLGGIGWVPNGVPPLKGGSSIGIPSQPAIWRPNAPIGERIVLPHIADAEEMQGFPRQWTNVCGDRDFQRARWKLVGNAVTLGVGRWIAESILFPKGFLLKENTKWSWQRWPAAAYGSMGHRIAVEANEWPERLEYRGLDELICTKSLLPLSLRAASGFRDRTRRSRLRFDPAFLSDIDDHISYWLHSAAA